MRTFAEDAALLKVAQKNKTAATLAHAETETPAPTTITPAAVHIAPIDKAIPPTPAPATDQLQDAVDELTVPGKPIAAPKTSAVHTKPSVMGADIKTQKSSTSIRNTAPLTYSQPIPQGKYDALTEEASKIGRAHRASILSDSEENFEMTQKHNTSGTIIRDTKRKRFKLIPAMIEASVGWFKNQQDAYETSRHPHHTIAKADARKEVIEAAVQKSARAPQEDFEAVAKRMKSVERVPVSSTLTFKEKAEVPPPQWSYTQEGEDALLQVSTTKANEDAGGRQQEAAGEDIEVPQATVTELETITDTDPLDNNIETLAVEPEIAPAAIADTKEQQREQVIPEAHTQTEETESAEEVSEGTVDVQPLPLQEEERKPVQTQPTAVQQVEQTQAPKRSFAVPQQSASTRSRLYLYALGGIILIASLSGIGLSFYFFGADENPETTAVVYRVPSMVQTQSQVSFSHQVQRLSLLQNLSALVSQNTGVTQLYPVHDQQQTEKPAAAQEIVAALALRAPGSFTRAIQEITFGAIGTEPFIVFTVTNFDTGFAGMLEWEQAMSADLSPLFGTPVTETFDSSARTDTQVRSAFFKDAIASNKNVRILFDEQGNDRIIYAFIDQNTVAITTTQEAFKSLLPLVR